MGKYEAEYKESLFSTLSLKLEVHTNEIICFGIIKKPNDRIDYRYTVLIPFDNIRKIELGKLKKCDALHIEAEIESDELSIYFPNITDVDGVKNDIIEAKRRAQEVIIERIKQEEERRFNDEKRRREQEESKRQHEKFVLTEITEVFQNNPAYIFEESENVITFMFIDTSKNLTIKSIDKEKMECVFSTIEYDKIHYYEKAGAIYYVSDINVNYSSAPSYGGSFVPGKVPLTPAIVGGLLFGQMGMVVGAIMGYNKRKYEPEQIIPTSLKIDSEAKRIDERSIIFNYYSEKNKQYMDVEFPQESYNFLQTYLVEKKHDIVLAIEKQTYASKVINIEEKPTSSKMSMQEFEDAVKKLKFMKENDLISEEEFIKKKEALLVNI